MVDSNIIRRLTVRKPVEYGIKVFVYVMSAVLLYACTGGAGHYHRIADGAHFPADADAVIDYPASDDGRLRIVTLNIAHGRNQTANQLLLNKEAIRHNIFEIGNVLRRINADVVALQEADGPSAWSGNFDHIEALAKQAGYPWYHRAEHAKSWLFNYGTAILSRMPVDEIMQHTFVPSPPTLNKGFLLSTIRWTAHDNEGETLSVDIVSVHLDFSRRSVREKQIAELSEALSDRSNPMIILGDFNSEWFAEDSVVKRLADESGMAVYRPCADNLQTYDSDNRYDWILISSELEFVHYEVLPDRVSDHLAVVAEITLKKLADRPASR